MNLEDKVGMDLVPQSEHLCYVRCNFCNTVLAVGIPCKRLLETVTVKCGHCSNLSFLSTRPPLQGQCLDPQTSLTLQSFCGDFRKGTQFPSPSSSTSSEPSSPKAPFVVKPPEKKYRLPSAYNRFMNALKQQILRYPIEKLSAQLLKIGLGTSQILQQHHPFVEVAAMASMKILQEQNDNV
ncbi:hypothetical protein ES332_A03G129700v1 [Gossypium tomentosum]|uniref:Uncharacterized protein n=1 Tax=Gossypium tomentosum TaxID=34277 RepID=A0A5D2R6N3_GOSTO|nr:hypothetical protein ES332_A03G129700v1 [Gossypium tomentosum]